MPFSRTVRADERVASCIASGCTMPASIASAYQRATWTSGSASTSRSSRGSSIMGSDVELEAVDVLVARDAQRALRALGRTGHLQLVADLLEVGDLLEVVLRCGLGGDDDRVLVLRRRRVEHDH